MNSYAKLKLFYFVNSCGKSRLLVMLGVFLRARTSWKRGGGEGLEGEVSITFLLLFHVKNYRYFNLFFYERKKKTLAFASVLCAAIKHVGLQNTRNIVLEKHQCSLVFLMPLKCSAKPQVLFNYHKFSIGGV